MTSRLAFVALAAVLGCGAEPRDLLLVTVDTLRPDHLGIYGYERPTSPNLDRFFAEGAVYERAYATHAHTPPSVVSILTGLYPRDHRVRLFYQLLPDETALIPDLLPSEFVSAGFVSNIVLTDEALGIRERFAHYDDFVDEKESVRKIYERGARRTTDAALEWLGQPQDPDARLFVWVHYIDPHGPYRPPEDWSGTFAHDAPRPIDPLRVPFYQRDPGVSDGLHYVDRYDEEIRYFDAQLGRLLEGFDAARGLERTLVSFTADHGESMMEHELWFTHGYHVYDEITRVPLLLRGPGVLPGRSPTLVSTIDLASTLLAAVGADAVETLPGQDLRRPARVPSERVLFTSGGAEELLWFAGVTGRRKVVVGVEPTGETVRRLSYDLDVDPAEQAARAARPGDPLLEQLEERVRSDPDPAGVPTQYRKGIQIGAPKVRPGISREAEAGLRALGYVE